MSFYSVKKITAQANVIFIVKCYRMTVVEYYLWSSKLAKKKICYSKIKPIF